MKNTSETILIQLVSIVFLLSGCNSKDDKAVASGVSDAFINYKFCLKNCDALATQYWNDYQKCMQECPSDMPADTSWLINGKFNFEAGKKAAALSKEANSKCKSNCSTAYEARMEELTQCRQVCADALPGTK